MKIAIGCPIRNRAWIIPEYIKALAEIDHDDKCFIFIENDSEDNTDRILRDELESRNMTARVWNITTDYPHWMRSSRNQDQYAHYATIRNAFLELFLLTNAEYLLSIDSDIIAVPNLIQRLLQEADGKTITGAAVPNIPGEKINGITPGNFMVKCNQKIKHPLTYPLTGTMTVDLIGAVYLIPRAAIEGGVRYGANWQGEDVPFCQAAQDKGYQLKVALDLVCQHKMIREGG